MRGGSPEARENITDSYICPITQVAPFAGVGPNVHIDRAPCPRDAGESHLSCRHQRAVLVKMIFVHLPAVLLLKSSPDQTV